MQPKVRLTKAYETAMREKKAVSAKLQVSSERLNKIGDLLSILERARLVRDLKEVPKEIRQKFKQIFIQHKPPKRIIRFKKEPIEISLGRDAMLRMDLIRAMNEEYEKIASDNNESKDRKEKYLQKISELDKQIQQLKSESETEFKLPPQSIDVTSQSRDIAVLERQRKKVKQQLEKHLELESIQ